MKKKFLLGIAAGMFAVATVVSFNVSRANGASDVSLDDIAVMASAQNEGAVRDTTKKGTKKYDEIMKVWYCPGDGSC
jgi:hypothetical protein